MLVFISLRPICIIGYCTYCINIFNGKTKAAYLENKSLYASQLMFTYAYTKYRTKGLQIVWIFVATPLFLCAASVPDQTKKKKKRRKEK